MSDITNSRGRDVAIAGTPRRRNNNHEAQAQAMQYADEAAKAAQRHLDMVEQISILSHELDEMRARAMAAEHENERLLKRERELMAMVDQKTEELHEDRDHVRQTIAVLAAQCNTASKILLETFSTIDKLGGITAIIEPPRLDADLLAEQTNEHARRRDGRDPDSTIQNRD